MSRSALQDYVTTQVHCIKDSLQDIIATLRQFFPETDEAAIKDIKEAIRYLETASKKLDSKEPAIQLNISG